MLRPPYKPKDHTRVVDEQSLEEYRTEVDRDISRLKHSPSFRRLQGKTQLFPGMESDFFRNRLTHSIEVAQIAKTIAKLINKDKTLVPEGVEFEIDADLCELAGLAHDIGHPPFGHQGEEALNFCMRDCGGFEGNAQTLRILARLEKKRSPDKICGILKGVDRRCGLNLTARSLASILKYDEEILYDQRVFEGTGSNRKELPIHKVKKGYYRQDADIVKWVKEQVLTAEPLDGKMKTVECQILDIADDIAYSVYDLEDSLKGGFVNIIDLVFPSKDLFETVYEEVLDSTKKYDELKYLTKILTKKVLLDEVQNYFAEYIGEIKKDTEKHKYISEHLSIFNALTKLGLSLIHI
jgi:dGTPase